MKTIRFPYMRTIVSATCFLTLIILNSRMLYAGGSAENAYKTGEYQQRQTMTASPFKSDQSVMNEETIQRVLTSKFELPKSIDIAILKIPDPQQQAIRYYGYGYFRSEQYLKNQQILIEAITREVTKSDRVSGTTLLPMILTPKEPTLGQIRETAVRLQSDMLLVFRLTSDVYEDYHLFRASQAKAFCTCEGFLLDVRTGLIPFSRIVTREFLASERAPDTNLRETMARAETQAAQRALEALGGEIVGFLQLIPPPKAVSGQQDEQRAPAEEFDSTDSPGLELIGDVDTRLSEAIAALA